MTRTVRRAFTLIELLVVITIIVVLLALLAPAMDKAVYQADLTRCAANLDAIANGANVYAMGNRRFYPHRTLFTDPASTQPQALSGTGAPVVNHPGGGQPGDLFYRSWDDRPVIRHAFPLSTVRDPLAPKIDMDAKKTQWVMASYGLWFGFGFRGEKFKRRVGDDFTFTQGASGGPRTHRFDVLAADYDIYIDNATQRSVSSHPDDLNRMSILVDTTAPPGWGYWNATNQGVRGKLDLNYAHDDGSVGRVDGVIAPEDDRMVTVPYMSSKYSYPVIRFQLPARR